jgi:hypothetical protein
VWGAGASRGYGLIKWVAVTIVLIFQGWLTRPINRVVMTGVCHETSRGSSVDCAHTWSMRVFTLESCNGEGVVMARLILGKATDMRQFVINQKDELDTELFELLKRITRDMFEKPGGLTITFVKYDTEIEHVKERCPAKESGGFQCDLWVGHKGAHACVVRHWTDEKKGAP